MPFPMKIQPIDYQKRPEDASRFEAVKPVAAKSRLKRLFERPFTNVLRISAAAENKAGVGVEEPQHFNGSGGEFEPSSVCLAKMVLNFMEDSNEKQQLTAARCSRNRSNCFNGNCNDSSDDELEPFSGVFGFCDSNLASSGEACELLKGLVSCPSVCERNLLADTARIVDKNKIICKRKNDTCRTVVTDNLLALGYDASVCKSRWEKCPSHPAGEYEYIDVIIKGERLLIDIDFRTEFEIARPTKSYKAILQSLPYIFVGKPDRLRRIIAVVSESAKQSLKKKGMPVPPWRKAEYVRAKWLSPHSRATTPEKTTQPLIDKTSEFVPGRAQSNSVVDEAEVDESVFEMSESESSCEEEKEKKEKKTVVKDWKPPEIKPKPKKSQIGVKIVTGLASVMEDEPSKF